MTTRGKAAEANAPQESALLDEAKQQGLEPIGGDVLPFGVAPLPAASEYGLTQRFSDLFPTPAKWQEYEQRPIDDLVNTDLIIRDAMFFESTMQDDAEWCIVLASDPATGETFTTMTGGAIILRKLHRAMAFPVRNEERNLLPMAGRFTKTESKTRGHSAYYDLI